MSGRTDPPAADTLEHSTDDSDESWLSVMDRLIDEGVDRSEAIQLTAEELSIDVPARFGEDPPRARWRFDGTVRVTIDGTRAPLAAWIRLWESNRSE